MKIVNMEKFIRKLQRMHPAIKKRVQADVMLAGREINVLQRSLAPRDEGVLVSTIRTEPMREPFVGAYVRAGGETTTKTLREGSDWDYDYAFGQEFGTSQMPANPFFWPAIRAKKAQTKRRIRSGIKKGIKDAAKG